MRILPLIIFSLVTVGLVVLFNTKLLIPAPLGKLLSPQHGVWQNAEHLESNFNINIKSPALKGKVTVYIDDRLVPHVFAENESDVFFVQGYLHAKFRLWQMELQTLSAAGRASEVVGKVAFNHDREFRRLGMVTAAEASLKEMESDPVTKSATDAYTAGVNHYISSLSESALPLEYKLLGYTPEKWSNLKTALFLKNMSENLAGGESDFEMTNAKSFFTPADFATLFPLQQDSLSPIIPVGTIYNKATVQLATPTDVDSLYYNNKDQVVTQEQKPDKDNGSNNWAVAGSRTVSGAPILCNDPHLGLNLPSLWFEMQLSTPTYNTYGVSFPGAPAVIIGYNDHCSWGVTNGGRDVRDYYEIRFKDESRKEYWYDSAWRKTEFKYEKFIVKDGATFIDTIAYTVFGPVMYDRSFSGGRANNNKNYAVRWKAHDPSNELKAFMLLNRAKNYSDYLGAVANMKCPGQNFVFAAKSGDIAMRTQGEWPAKWKGQGDFVMPGTDGRYLWQAMIPNDETPAQYNPARGYVSSANQYPADSSYPYYLGHGYTPYRGIIINKMLDTMTAITPAKMMAMQTSNYNVFGETTLPVFLKNIQAEKLQGEEVKFYDMVKTWDYMNDTSSVGATMFAIWWKNFDSCVFDDDYKKAPAIISRPYESSLVEGILKDSSYRFVDNIETPAKETLGDAVTQSFKSSVDEFKRLSAQGRLQWARYKSTTINHLLRLGVFSRRNLPIGGGLHCINATKTQHGPSWRMVVSLTSTTEAYGIFPGGQSGNPASRFYDNNINKWALGEYNQLWLMKREESGDKRIRWVVNFSKS
ncbi:MAG: penicillin acylase family protein [Ferruginibacter sp.]|nr:penicillin acylase family protein [Ferruginibacter sp.]